MDKIVLVGNPNTGKTTLFNNLTKSSEHTGNWHGVTVDGKTKKIILNGKKIEVVDLPGVYSLSGMSFEEKITCNYLFNNQDYLIVNILDINNLYRNLYLTLDVLSMQKPTILVVNVISKIKQKKYSINTKALEQKLGVRVLAIDAQSKQDVEKLKNAIIEESIKKHQKNNLEIIQNFKINNLILDLKNVINNKQKNINLNEDFVCLKCLENDNEIISRLSLNDQENKGLQQITKKTSFDEIAKIKYQIINSIFCECKIKQNKNFTYGKSKIDKYILNKYFCLPILFAIMLLIFYLTFFSVGKHLSAFLMDFIQNDVGVHICNLIKSVTSSPIIYDFFRVAIIGGLGSIFSFLPQVIILFICLGVLEESGYLSRLAFMLDGTFSKVGLCGKSVYTLLMGFGCSAVSCLTARTMEDKNTKIKTAMIAPYLSCSAKLPLYTVLGSAFFGASNVFVIFAMYLLGVIVALLLSVFYEKTFLKSGKQTFILEFPPYRTVGFKKILVITLQNIKQFIVRVGTTLFAVNIIVWVLSNFSFTFKYVPLLGGFSMLESIGKIISPIFSPLGFGSWGATSALLAGLVAKEIIVSSIAMINGVYNQPNYYFQISNSLTNKLNPIHFTPASAISYMVFCLLYLPCVATMAVLKKEIGKKWLFTSMIVQFFVAYVISLVVYHMVNIVLNKGIMFLLLYFCLFGAIAFALVYFIKHFGFKKCHGCRKCG